MNILVLNAGNETGGGMRHILQMLDAFSANKNVNCQLGVFEKKDLYRHAQKLPIKVIHFQIKQKWNLTVLNPLVLYIQNHKITHVHTHGPRANVYMSYIKRKVNVNWLITIHSNPFVDFLYDGLRGKLLTNLHLRAIKKADYLITVCSAYKQILIDKGFKNEKIKVIQNGYDFTRKDMNEAVDVNSKAVDEFIIVQVARLEKVKGHTFAIQALKKLKDQHKMNVHLYLIGGGSLTDTLKKEVENLGLETSVHFIGETEKVDIYYQKAHMVLLTSVSEGFPYVLLEAANWKKPVVATNVGDINQLICTNDIGWIVPKEDVLALYEGMMEAIQLHVEGRLHERGEKFYHFAKNNFSLDKCVNEVYNIYQHM